MGVGDRELPCVCLNAIECLLICCYPTMVFVGPVYPLADMLMYLYITCDTYSNPFLMFRFAVFIDMQYKFCVDGEWRHDESQSFVRGDYGLVNTVFLARQPDMIPSTFSPQTPGRSNMDVDFDVNMPVVREFLFKS
jgi:hypothetical protein